MLYRAKVRYNVWADTGRLEDALPSPALLRVHDDGVQLSINDLGFGNVHAADVIRSEETTGTNQSAQFRYEVQG